MNVLDKTVSQITIPTPFAVGDTHVYLLKGEKLSLVDAGVKTKEAWEALCVQLKEIGYRPNDIEQIILTHHHPDHIGFIEEFPRVDSIVAHKNVDLWLTKDESHFQKYEHFFQEYFVACGVPDIFRPFLEKLRDPLRYMGNGKLTSTLEEGDTLPGHKDWQVIETKGHAQSHLSFFRQSDGTFIGGDHLLQHISSNPLLEPPQDGEKGRTKPLLQYRENLNKCLDLGIHTVLPGHGSIFGNVEELIPLRLIKQEKRAMKVLEYLKREPQTPFEVCTQLFPKQYKLQLDLTMSETIGQIDFLESRNLVRKSIENGVIYYYAA